LLLRRLEEARYYAENALTLARQSAAPGVLAATLNQLGNALMAQLRYTEALTCIQGQQKHQCATTLISG
jgi:hypothetical protein